MHNTIAYDIVVGLGCGIAVALIVWVLADGLRTGKLPLKYSAGWVRRDKQPFGFWLVWVVSAIMAVGASFGVLVLFLDLFYR
jgi:hypothetical protein